MTATKPNLVEELAYEITATPVSYEEANRIAKEIHDRIASEAYERGRAEGRRLASAEIAATAARAGLVETTGDGKEWPKGHSRYIDVDHEDAEEERCDAWKFVAIHTTEAREAGRTRCDVLIKKTEAAIAERNATAAALASFVPCQACGWAHARAPERDEELPIVRGALDAQAAAETRNTPCACNRLVEVRALLAQCEPVVRSHLVVAGGDPSGDQLRTLLAAIRSEQGPKGDG